MTATTLPPHDWDGDAHRAAIHTAFDIWFTCYMQKDAKDRAANAHQAARWQRTLRELTDRAKDREAVLNRTPAPVEMEGV